MKYDRESGMLMLHNYMDFVDLTEYAALTYQVSCDGEVIDSGFIPYLTVSPCRRTAKTPCRWPSIFPIKASVS